MSTSSHVMFQASIVAALVFAAESPTYARQDDASDELKKRIAELEAKSARSDARNAELESRLAALEAEKGAQWLTEQRAEQIRGLVQEVLADADTRASMLQGIAAGYDDGLHSFPTRRFRSLDRKSVV